MLLKSRLLLAGLKDPKILLALGAVTFISIGLFLLLEIADKQCPKYKISYEKAAQLLETCDILAKKYNFEKEEGLAYTETFDEKLKKRVLHIPREQINSNNGQVCYSTALIANDLPKFAKKYIAVHESLHLSRESNETKANFKAGLKEPLGLVQTVFYSISLNTKVMFSKKLSFKDNMCKIVSMYRLFKVYFLNMDLANYYEWEW